MILLLRRLSRGGRKRTCLPACSVQDTPWVRLGVASLVSASEHRCVCGSISFWGVGKVGASPSMVVSVCSELSAVTVLWESSRASSAGGPSVAVSATP